MSDKYEIMFKKFKNKLESMSHEERISYIDSLGLKPISTENEKIDNSVPLENAE